MRVIATAGDSESGIKDIAIVSELNWRCAGGRGDELIGALTTAPLPFNPNTPPSEPPSFFQINTVADPILATGCSMEKQGSGPVSISGFVRVIATNGAGLADTSKTFIFEYLDVGIRH